LAASYAEEVIDHIVPLLVENGWAVVSGGAAGADTMAHKATLAAKGKTIVVVGTGLLECYPKKNMALFEHVVAKGGTILSIFPLATESNPFNFPARNRVISGLSRGCVVVQAADKSGALITARFALEQGREVFAVPGLVNDDLSYGCHALIQQGAKLVTGAADIVVEFGETLPTQESGEEETKSEVQTNNRLVTKLSKIKDTGKQPALQKPQEEQLAFVEIDETTPEGKIIRACARPCTVDDLLEISSLPLGTLQSLLFDLQLNDKLVQTMTGMWQISQK
jgi:DNA processing protein